MPPIFYSLTFTNCLQLNLQNCIDSIAQVCYNIITVRETKLTEKSERGNQNERDRKKT